MIKARFDRTIQHFNFRFSQILLCMESESKSFLGLLIVAIPLKNLIATVGSLDGSLYYVFWRELIDHIFTTSVHGAMLIVSLNV